MRIALGIADDPVAVLRGVEADSVVLVIAPGRDPVALAMVRAAIGPLAVAHAPARRVNAVCPSADTAPDRIDATVSFLDSARSTTGQVLDLV